MENNLIDTFKVLSIKDKRNEVVNLILKMDFILKEINPNNLNYRDVENYVYKYEDDYLNDIFKNIYNLYQNFLDYVYDLKK